MTIIVSEQFEGRTSKIGLYLKRTHGRQFVASSNANERSYAILAASGVPRVGDAHPEDIVSLCVDVDAKPHGAPNAWIVSCKYTNDLPDDTIDDDDPTAVRPKESWGAADFSRYVSQDRDDKPILNTAGDRYDEPIEIIDTFPTLSISKNKNSFSVTQAFDYNNSVNSDTFKGAAPGTLRVLITANEEWKGDAAFWAMSYTFTYNPNGWQPTLLESGLYQKVASDRVPCTVKGIAAHDAEPVTSPVPLDADGEQINPANLTNTPSPVVHTTWDVLPELPYSALGV
jgi:hypothetical protein